jgi:DNA-binding response OmpR family regulator
MADAQEQSQPTITGSVLIIDDVQDNIDVIGRRLTSRGFTVHSAISGRKGLQLLATEQIDLVLLDVMMMDVTGMDVLRTVRTKLVQAKLPIIMVSARDDEAIKVHALAAGANDYVCKPFKFGELLARIVTHLRARQQYLELAKKYDALKSQQAA